MKPVRSTGPQPYPDAMLREMVTRPDLADLAQLIGWPIMVGLRLL